MPATTSVRTVVLFAERRKRRSSMTPSFRAVLAS
jgi:hypothetical protein